MPHGANSWLSAVFVGAAAAAAAGITAPFQGSAAPVPVSLRRPGGIHQRTGRTAGPQERYNCHLLLLHIVNRRARRLNQKKRLFTSQAKQRVPLGRGSSRPPLSAVISAKEGRGCALARVCVRRGAGMPAPRGSTGCSLLFTSDEKTNHHKVNKCSNQDLS